MNKVIKITATALATVAMFGSSMVAQSTNAVASSTYKRSKTTKLKAKPYYSTNSKGKTYAFKGSAKHLVLKSNHALKNYKTTTWTRTKKAYVTKHGKKYLYYYVTNSKNNAKGWVWHKYLKAGKNYQSSKVTSYKGTYQQKKAGKFYTITGNKSYIKFSHGVKLTNAKYSATKKRTIYKHGKSYKYYYVANKTTHKNGWVWNGYVKKAAKVKKATSTTKSTQPAKPTKTTATSSSSSASSSSSSANSSSSSTNNTAFSTGAVASNVVSVLNQERAADGRAGLTVDGILTTIGNIRAQQLVTDFSHNYKGTTMESAVLAKQYGIYDSYYATEDLIVAPIHEDNNTTAKDIVDSFDAAHRDNIMNASFSKIGVGLYKDPSAYKTLYVAIQLGF